MMLLRLSLLNGHHLAAIDGDFGTVKDFSIDDKLWLVRYVLADTGLWLKARQILISPLFIKSLKHTNKRLQVSLTRHQIEMSPSIGTSDDITYYFERSYYDYFRPVNPQCLQGGKFGSQGRQSVDELQEKQLNSESAFHHDGISDPHLRNAQAMHGYQIHGIDGDIGQIVDFILDDTWTICQMVIATGPWFSGQQVTVPTNLVDRIDVLSTTVTMRISRETVTQSPLCKIT